MKLKFFTTMALAILVGAPRQLTAQNPINFCPQTLEELGNLFDVGLYPHNVALALDITLAGMKDSNPFVHNQAADDFFELLRKLPPHECSWNHTLFKRGIYHAIIRSSYCHYLNSYVQQIFDRILDNNAYELHKALVESILQAIEDNKKSCNSDQLLNVLKSCLETCGDYATGSIGGEKFHARIIAQAARILQARLQLSTKTAQASSARRLHATETVITLLHQAARLSDRVVQQQVYALGQEVYRKLSRPSYHKKLKGAGKAHHTNQMERFKTILPVLEKTAGL